MSHDIGLPFWGTNLFCEAFSLPGVILHTRFHFDLVFLLFILVERFIITVLSRFLFFVLKVMFLIPKLYMDWIHIRIRERQIPKYRIQKFKIFKNTAIRRTTSKKCKHEIISRFKWSFYLIIYLIRSIAVSIVSKRRLLVVPADFSKGHSFTRAEEKHVKSPCIQIFRMQLLCIL